MGKGQWKTQMLWLRLLLNVESLPSMCEAPGPIPIPCIANKKVKTKPNQNQKSLQTSDFMKLVF